MNLRTNFGEGLMQAADVGYTGGRRDALSMRNPTDELRSLTMTHAPTRLIIGLLIMLATCGGIRAAEPDSSENPVYRSWSKFRKGASVTYLSVTKQKATSTEMSMTYTLVDVTPEKVVVESVVRLKANGKEVVMPPSRLVNSKASGISNKKPGQANPNKPDGFLSEGTESIPIAGRTVVAQWTKVKTRSESAENLIQTWSSDEIPGGLVKSVTTVPGSVASVTMELTSVTTP